MDSKANESQSFPGRILRTRKISTRFLECTCSALHFLFSRAIFFPIFSCRLPSLFLSPFSFFLFLLPPGRVRRVELFFNSSKWKRTRFRVINEVKFIEQRRKIIHAPHSRPRGVKILLIMFLVKRPARDTRSNELGIRIHPKSFS